MIRWANNAAREALLLVRDETGRYLVQVEGPGGLVLAFRSPSGETLAARRDGRLAVPTVELVRDETPEALAVAAEVERAWPDAVRLPDSPILWIPLPYAHSPLAIWTPCGHGCAPGECPGGDSDPKPARAIPEAPAALPEVPAPGLPLLEIAFAPAEGIVLRGTTREMAPAVKDARGWKWWRDGGVWYRPRTRDTVQNQGRLELLATDLRRALSSARIEAAVRVTFSLEGGVRPAAEREADRVERAEARAERLDDRADRLATEAGTRDAAARKIADMIPMGQPILVGHHSEKRHRKDIARIRGGFEKAHELSQEAAGARGAAESARKTVERAEKPGAILRRIDRLEAERRKIERGLKDEPATPEEDVRHRAWAEAARVRLAAIVDEVGHLRSKLEGVDLPSAARYSVGQTIESGHGRAVVLRVNPKSLTVQLVPERRFISPPDGVFKVPYDRLAKGAPRG